MWAEIEILTLAAVTVVLAAESAYIARA